MFQTDLSPALAFLTATVNALPKTMGERERSQTLAAAMVLAINARMEFRQYDYDELTEPKFRVLSSVGVFRPLEQHWYALACRAGGTYARMWENHSGMRPWKAPVVVAYGSSDRLKNNRLAQGLGILLPFAQGERDESLQHLDEGEVWWCTSLDNDQIVLCQYRMRRCIVPQQPEGKPAKRRTFTRDQWEALMASLAPQQAAA